MHVHTGDLLFLDIACIQFPEYDCCQGTLTKHLLAIYLLVSSTPTTPEQFPKSENCSRRKHRMFSPFVEVFHSEVFHSEERQNYYAAKNAIGFPPLAEECENFDTEKIVPPPKYKHQICFTVCFSHFVSFTALVYVASNVVWMAWHHLLPHVLST